MKIIEAEQAQYLIKSLQHHPSPYIIFDKNSGVEWLNNSAQYIFNLKDDESISIEPITDINKNASYTISNEKKKITTIGTYIKIARTLSNKFEKKTVCLLLIPF